MGSHGSCACNDYLHGLLFLFSLFRCFGFTLLRYNVILSFYELFLDTFRIQSYYLA